jgi:hypothetical protein
MGSGRGEMNGLARRDASPPTAGRNLLVLLLPDGSEAELQREIAARATEGSTVNVVARPGSARSSGSPRTTPAGRRTYVRSRRSGCSPTRRMSRPRRLTWIRCRLEDALRSFPARRDPDRRQRVRKQRPGDVAAALRLPVTRLGGSLPPPERQELRETARAIVAGRSKATPFVFFAGVNLTLAGLAAPITAIVVLVIWLG